MAATNTSVALGQSNAITQIIPGAGAFSYVMQPGDSGKTVLLPTLAGAATITLPPLQPNLRYRILNVSAGAALGFSATFAPNTAANIVSGSLINFTAVAVPVMTPVVKNGAANVAFLAASVEGDFLDLNCDGNYWYVSGISSVVGFA